MLVYSSQFVDRDQVANGRGAVSLCDGAKFRYKSLKNEISAEKSLKNEISAASAAANYSNHGKYLFGSTIFEYSRIFEQFVSTLLFLKRTIQNEKVTVVRSGGISRRLYRSKSRPRCFFCRLVETSCIHDER